MGYIELDDETGEAIGADYSGLELSELPENLKFQYRGYKGDWTSNISNFTNTIQMFYNCTKLTSFNGDLSSLTNGNRMFYNCTKLTSFNGDLSSLTNGNDMFNSCSKLTSFNGDLSSLTDGSSMFYNCKLDAFSVEKILTTIPTYTDGSSHKLTMRIQKGEAVNKFNEITGSTGDSGTYNYKGWTISLSSIQV